MSYFETDQESNLINTINKVAEEQGKDIAIMVELIGPNIRVLGFRKSC